MKVPLLYLAASLLLGPAASIATAECTEEASPLAKPAEGFRPGSAAAPDSTDQWGYGYDSLLADLARWKSNPLVKVDSIGRSAQGRALWMVTVTEGADSVGRPSDPAWRKRRVMVHARTHPSEVQGHRISAQMISQLLDSTEKAREVRRDFIFNIIPMYNPDGVELGYGRLNANRVDIESNWDKPNPEPEVVALRGHFDRLMASPVPVEVALNLHSDRFNCTRFFFFHEAGGTSAAYVELEKDYIGKVRSHFPSGIEEWFFVRSWSTATGTQYPEGYWWTRHRENVMALTYEDANCPGATAFDSTARALIHGSVDYLRPRTASLRRFVRPDTWMLREPGGIRVRDAAGRGWTAWALADAGGRRLREGAFRSGAALVPTGGLPPGAHVLLLSGPAGAGTEARLIPSLVP